MYDEMNIMKGRHGMKPIELKDVQKKLDKFSNKEVYVHVETTNGAYASHFDNQGYNVGAYIRNAKVTYTQGKIKGDGNSYRVGLDRKSTRLNSSHVAISYAVFCLKKKKHKIH